jgi:hypothetical protein
VKGDTLEYEVKKKFEEINVIVYGVKWVFRWVVGYVINASTHRVTYYIGISQMHSVAPDLSSLRSRGYVPCSHVFMKYWEKLLLSGGFTAKYDMAILVTSDEVHNRIESGGTCIYRSYYVLWWRAVEQPGLKCYRVMLSYRCVHPWVHSVWQQWWYNSLIHFIYFRTSYKTDKGNILSGDAISNTL